MSKEVATTLITFCLGAALMALGGSFLCMTVVMGFIVYQFYK